MGGPLRHEFSAAEIHELLENLGRRVARRGLHLDLFIVGGAALAMDFDRERVTADIDLKAKGSTDVLADLVEEIAVEEGLPSGWLNTDAAAWVPPLEPTWPEGGKTFGGLTVVVASAEVLLAMKLLSDRERDVDDMVALVRHLRVRDPREVVAIFQSVYPDGAPARDPLREELLVSAREIVEIAWREPIE